MDETLAVFGVVRDPTAHALATTSCCKIGMSVPNACSRARGGRGPFYTQGGGMTARYKPACRLGGSEAIGAHKDGQASGG